MSLLPPEFGLRTGDPCVPELILHSVRAGRNNRETAMWVSSLPLSHALNICTVNPEWRIEATVEHATAEGRIEPPWWVTLDTTRKRLVARLSWSGETGWWAALGHSDRSAMEACAQGYIQVVWSVWYATAEVHTPDSIVGVLWMLAAGISWDNALARARLEEATP